MIIISFSIRTTTNTNIKNDIFEVDEENNVGENDETQHTSKRKRSNSNGSEHLKIIENIAKTTKENQTKKMEMFHQAVQPQSELELFFSSICKTVEKFNDLTKARLKIEISKVVSEEELKHLQNINNQIVYTVETVPTQPNDNIMNDDLIYYDSQYDIDFVNSIE